ncbi:MAG TPA: acyl-CoA dehydrogenase family protein [Bacteroidales bacterium]|nr:acyl-CoA dehydrogenase family protein [Bacteroidales bacterium]HQQ02818.1 acyl-CoA dehydrogenase family protein [Bacteroidales bacterium]
MANFYTDNKSLKFYLSHPLMEKIIRLREFDYSEKNQYDYAPVDFEDALDSYDKVLEIIGEICGDIVAVNADDVDKEGPHLINNEVIYARGTQENLKAIKNAGLFGISLPRQYGGLNFSIVPYVMSAEIVSRADASFSNIWGLQDCAETIHEFASEEIKNEFLPRFPRGATAAMALTEPDAGSDLQAVQLKATPNPDGKTWRLNGVKRFITNGDADISLVLARSEENTTDARGLSLFLYDRNSKAVTIRRIENKLGIKGSPTCELVFKDAPALLVGERKMGLIKYVIALMNSARLGVGAQSVGIAEAAYREALKYASEREQFGKSIVSFPAVYEMITRMGVKIDAMRSLLYETARFVDVNKSYNIVAARRKLEPNERNDQKYYQKMADIYTPLLKLISSEYCNQIVYDAIQVHGGTGYMKDFPVERLYRDARITSIYEGTSQLQVVAAIRGVTTGVYLKAMQDYDAQITVPEQEYLKRSLQVMTRQFEETVNKVIAENDTEMIEFHSRRLVEMAGNIIMGYLLLIDSQREPDFLKSAQIFIENVKSENQGMHEYIMNFDERQLSSFKFV